VSTLAPQEPPAPRLDPIGALAGTDHKRLGVRLVVTAFAFFLIGGVLALLVRTELAAPGMQVLSEDAYNQVFSMHGSVMIYLFVTPIALALGVYLVPLQVGAAEIAAPRMALLGYWLYLLGGLVALSGFFTAHGAAKSGWAAFEPLSDEPYSPGSGMDLWLVGVVLATLGTIALAACVLGTLLSRRAPGLTLMRMPVFSWSMLVTCLMVLPAFPSLVLAFGLLYVDRRLGGVFEGAGGATAYQQLFWFYGHPVVYVMFFPFVGAVAETISTFSGRRFFGYPVTVVSLLVFTALSMSVWAHHMYTSGQVENRYYALTSTALLVPAGVEYFGFLATMWGGRIRLKVPMLFALGFVVQFLVGGVTGIFVGSPPLDYAVHDTYWVVAHFHYTLFAGSVFGLFAGFYLWFPKVTGRMLGERLGHGHFWLMTIGTNLTFLPMFFLGEAGMRRQVANYEAGRGLEGLNQLATAGAFLIALSILLFLVNVARSVRSGRPAGDDPWGGQTLEWATSSPPPRLNFDRPLPPIRSYAPLLDLREEAEDIGDAALGRAVR
jgi:cytochrome c oxidase subunit 1